MGWFRARVDVAGLKAFPSWFELRRASGRQAPLPTSQNFATIFDRGVFALLFAAGFLLRSALRSGSPFNLHI